MNSYLKRIFSKTLVVQFILWIALSLFLSFIVELGNQEVLLLFLEHNSIVFLLNTMMIAGYLSFSFLFPRQIFVMALLGLVVFVLGVANSFITLFRGVPLSYNDLFSIQDGLSLIGDYFTLGMLIVNLGVVVVVCICLVGLYRFKTEQFKRNIPILLLFYIVFLSSTNVLVSYARSNSIVEDRNWDLLENARENGFVYSFVRSYELSIVEVPMYYEQLRLEQINLTHETNEHTPTIIVYQLESFMDPYWIKGTNYSFDPFAYYRSLQEKYTTGNLKVPTYGGGTVRTEFEVITGMSMDFFPPGEIPYNRIAKNNVLETPAFVLKNIGIPSTFIHNFEGNFYNRNVVYSNLGFDRFISMEYMETLPEKQHFPDDTHVVTKIIESIESTSENDFIFAVGVDGHGPYQSEYQDNPYGIEVYTSLESEDLRRVQDYVYKIIRVQESIERVVDYIMQQEEEIILVLYSDHLPNLASSTISYKQESRYTTSYVIVDNFSLEKQDEDVSSYQLLSKVFQMIDVYGGLLPLYHERYKESALYLENLHLLQHDLSYGNHYTNNQNYNKTTMQFGKSDIKIEQITKQQNQTKIEGTGFTFASTVFVDGVKVKTTFIDESLLIIDENIKIGSEVKIGQIGRNETILSYSSTYRVK